MTHIYLHIGSHKTGTSAIQSALFAARAALLQAGINYLAIGANHSIPLYSLVTPDPHLYRLNILQGIDTPDRAADYNASIRAQLVAELEQNRSGKFVISGEDLSVLPAESVSRLHALLAPYADKFTVIIYVREPRAFMLSAAQERLKAGRTLAAVCAKPLLPDYRGRTAKFIDVFGRENVMMRPFVRSAFREGDLLIDFLDALGAPLSLRPQLQPVTSNTSISYEAALLLDEANQMFPLIEGNRANPARSPMLTERLAGIEGQPFNLPPDAFRHTDDAVAEDLAWLRQTMGYDPFAAEVAPSKALEQPVPLRPEALRSLVRLINAMALESVAGRR
jgi:hypothetical protein